MKKITFLLAVAIAFSTISNSYAQDVRRVAFDIRGGLPGVIGLNAEYVTGALDNRLSFFANYNGFATDVRVEGVDESLSYFEIGSNVYLGTKGKGLYGSIGYGNINIDATYYDVSDDGNNYAKATGDFTAGTLNVKAGIKLGGILFFRGEIGYGFGDIPSEVEVTGETSTISDTFLIERPEFPGMSDSGYVIANIGFGIAF
ncbi:hypothetical protein [Urechidicola vernalis]|uniref:Outer membrane protein beta-barrel domain-containing protein n=1 Tax=Urechidicola vernalis TaxID=3075600 RepID=A0ABU2Y328_9FLAO|nr:hypothetical protein [Urechidicola sp. P050]MDT0552221.1 hypothetical protein [Urechidicola sp. P050]